MCNLAAYAGTRPAAPILLELLERQEGLCSGHFSGISTVCDGKVYTARICGDSKRLRLETDAENLPGTVGIAHSRTPGTTPTAAWSHPFPVGDKLAYCANGFSGCFAEWDHSIKLRELTDAGVKFLSEIDTPQTKPKRALPNGHTVHISEMNAQLLARAHFQGKLPLISALRRMFGEAPSEIVALAIAADEDGSVSALRFNQPLMWCRREDGAFLATSALAFPDELHSMAVPIPPCTTLTMTRERLTIEPMTEHAEFLCREMKLLEAAGVMRKTFAERGECTFKELVLEVAKLYPAGRASQRAIASYIALAEMLRKGEVEPVPSWVPASLPGAEAPQWRFRPAAGAPAREVRWTAIHRL